MPAGNIYGYTPSLPVAVVALVLFFVTTCVHFYQAKRARSWFLVPLLVGGCFEVLGYVFRLVSRTNLGSVGLYAMQTLFILLAPALFAASIYIILGRLLISINAPQVSIVPVKWMTRFFIMGDIIAFLSQCAGGAIQASASSSGNVSKQQVGSDVVMGGLGVQILFFTFYIVTVIIAHVRLTKLKIEQSPGARLSWFWMILAVYAVSLLILIRCVFRLIEYHGGYSGPIMTTEVYSYCLDALPMLLVMVILNICHPSYAIPSKPRAAAQRDPLEMI